jgi:hypothetical protein
VIFYHEPILLKTRVSIGIGLRAKKKKMKLGFKKHMIKKLPRAGSVVTIKSEQDPDPKKIASHPQHRLKVLLFLLFPR